MDNYLMPAAMKSAASALTNYWYVTKDHFGATGVVGAVVWRYAALSAPQIAVGTPYVPDASVPAAARPAGTKPGDAPMIAFATLEPFAKIYVG